MDSFEAFKESRLAMDPSTKKLTDHQWEQSYKAYLSSRKRVRATSQRSSSESNSEDGSRRRRSSQRSGGGKSHTTSKGQHLPASLTKAALLKHQIKQESAYQDLRLLLNVVVYVLMGLVVFRSLFQVFLYTSTLSVVSMLLDAALQIVLLLIGKWLLHVIIDIPDILLYRELNAGKDSEATESDGAE